LRSTRDTLAEYEYRGNSHVGRYEDQRWPHKQCTARWSITKAARGSFGERFQKRLAAGDQRNFASFSETGTNPSSRCCWLAIQPI
jgi:hypothetical protein